ncbi:MAG: hypothetical protein QOF76_62, partial [Solirubrobacteraceae bacterium]|nr:hypothetical protein [Solirubrobacteraceae bacterium]
MNPDQTVALVAGGASGLGRATVDALLERGATVVILDLPSSAAHVETTDRLHFAGADITDGEQVTAAVDLAARLGPLRICLNCAGIGSPRDADGTSRRSRIAVDGTPADLDGFQQVVGVNLLGTFNVARVAAAAMQRTEPVDGERGIIINVSSIVAYESWLGQVPYAASKAGVIGMTLAIARDLADSLIRCVTIAPGIFHTPILRNMDADGLAALAGTIPHPARLGEPAEFAAFALSAIENQMLNGETIRLDGA